MIQVRHFIFFCSARLAFCASNNQITFVSQVFMITGLDLDILKRCRTVLRTIACGYAVDVAVFKNYALETARMLVTLYPWYYMPASVHAVLVDGAAYMQYSPVPIGLLSGKNEHHNDTPYFLSSFIFLMSQLLF